MMKTPFMSEQAYLLAWELLQALFFGYFMLNTG